MRTSKEKEARTQKAIRTTVFPPFLVSWSSAFGRDATRRAGVVGTATPDLGSGGKLVKVQVLSARTIKDTVAARWTTMLMRMLEQRPMHQALLLNASLESLHTLDKSVHE